MPQNAFCFDDYDLDRLTEAVGQFGQDRFGYVVTPNTDHLIRIQENPGLRRAYEDASAVLLDSRVVALLMRALRGMRLPVCPGSDVTARLLGDVVRPEDPLVLVGGTTEQALRLMDRFNLQCLAHHNPPMGFIDDEQAVEECLQFVEAQSPFRFCLIAVGSPQQEILAQRLQARGRARGLALCVGASIDFLTGKEQRAPLWMQRCGLEWLYRLLQNPRRLAYRYLVRGPRILPLLRELRIVLRPPALTALPASRADA